MTVHGPVISSNTLQVQMVYDSGGELVQNTYHVHKATAWSNTDMQLIADAFTNWETVTAAPLRSEDVDLVRVTVTDLTSLTSGRIDEQLTSSIPGTLVSPVLPNNVTFALKAAISGRGRGRAGRTFWIGLAENQVFASNLDTAAANAIVTAMNTLINDIATAVATAFLSVMHLFIGGVYQVNAPTSPILEYVFTDLNTDSQKDRLPKHKAHKR